jgi:nickel transport protein
VFFNPEILTKERMIMVFWRILCMATLIVSLTTARGAAHGVDHTVTRTDAVVVSLSHDDAETFSNEAYEIFGPGDVTPFETGRTDKLGRIIFVPDRTGKWRVRAFSEDGHGVDFTVDVDDLGNLAEARRSPGRGVGIPLAGVVVILTLFGILSLFLKKRKG